MYSDLCYAYTIAIIFAAASSQIQAFPLAPKAQREQTLLNMITLSTPSISDNIANLPDFVLPTLKMPKMGIMDSWYTENSVLRGKMVYEDLPSEYTLISAGSDWPKMNTSPDVSHTPEQKHRRPFKSLRKIANWAKNLRRNKNNSR